MGHEFWMMVVLKCVSRAGFIEQMQMGLCVLHYIWILIWCRLFNSLIPGGVIGILKVLLLNTCYKLNWWALFVKLLSSICHRTPLINIVQVIACCCQDQWDWFTVKKENNYSLMLHNQYHGSIAPVNIILLAFTKDQYCGALIFCLVSLNKLLDIQLSCQWSKTPWHSNDIILMIFQFQHAKDQLKLK